MTTRQAALAFFGLLAGIATLVSWVDCAVAAAVLGGLVAGSPGFPRKALWVRLRPFLFFAAVTLLFGGLGEGRTFAVLGPLHWSEEQVARSLLAAVRLVLLGAGVSWISLAVGTSALANALWRASATLKRRRIDVGPVVVGFAVAMRFLPILQEEARRLQAALRARGAWLLGRGVVGRVRYAVGLVVPILAAALRRAEMFAAAVEVRAQAAGGGGDAAVPVDSYSALEAEWASRPAAARAQGGTPSSPAVTGMWTAGRGRLVVTLAWVPAAFNLMSRLL